MALMLKKLCLKRYCGIDGSLEAFLVCKLISFGKNPGVRHIGIGEDIRKTLGCSVMTTFRRNILEIAGDFQLCAGQRTVCETAVKALSSTLCEDDSDEILLVDTENSFNKIN